MYRIFLVQDNGELSGPIGIYEIHQTREDAEKAADKWRKSHDYKHTYEVYWTDNKGRIGRDPYDRLLADS